MQDVERISSSYPKIVEGQLCYNKAEEDHIRGIVRKEKKAQDALLGYQTGVVRRSAQEKTPSERMCPIEKDILKFGRIPENFDYSVDDIRNFIAKHSDKEEHKSFVKELDEKAMIRRADELARDAEKFTTPEGRAYIARLKLQRQQGLDTLNGNRDFRYSFRRSSKEG